MKIKKSAWTGIMLIILMLGSTFAYAIIQGLGFYRPSSPSEVELPTANIIDYELTTEQESYAMRIGKTILKFEYATVCTECLNQKALVESIANEKDFSGQIILEEIIKNVDKSVLTITSSYGRNILTNVTADEVINSVCSLLTEPPIYCTVRNI